VSIPVMKPLLPKYKAVEKYIKLIDANRSYSNFGPLLETLEERYANFFNVETDQVVCSANATLALMGASSLAESKSIYVPSFTFPATIHAALASGKKVEMTDIDSHTWMLPEDEILNEARIQVLPFGSQGDLILGKTFQGLRVIDAAASIGNYEGVLNEISGNEIVIFSLHATKILGIGEGAVSIFGDAQLARRYRNWINFGFEGSRNSLTRGVNAKLSEISAAYGHAALDSWEIEKADWLRVGNVQSQIEQKLQIAPYFSSAENVSPYWIVEFANELLRDAAVKELNASKIDSRLWWESGCHRMPAFMYLAHGRSFSNTEAVASRLLGLPKYRDLEEEKLIAIEKALLATLSA
jgi:dTDP-4-amino-4,6-dideoxygalactose transaminase